MESDRFSRGPCLSAWCLADRSALLDAAATAPRVIAYTSARHGLLDAAGMVCPLHCLGSSAAHDPRV